MNLQEIRLELLKLATPSGISNPDTKLIIERAKAYEAYVTGAGQPSEAPPKPVQQPQPQVRTSGQSHAPARR